MDERASTVVVVGAAASGVGTLATLVGELPPDLDATVCLVLHLPGEAKRRIEGTVGRPAREVFSLRHRDDGRRPDDLEVSQQVGELRSLVADLSSHRNTGTLDNPAEESRQAGVLDVEVSALAVPGEHFAGVIVSLADSTGHLVLEAELDHTRGELETANTELQRTVEELETTNRELESTNEALETTGGELQSANGALEKMMAELQSTNEELETLNEELRERTNEALQANAALASVLSGIRQGVVVVDRTLRVLAWSRRATDLWGLRDDEVEGEHLLNLDIGIPVQRLRDPIRRVLAGEKTAEVELEGHDRRGKPVHVRIGVAPLESPPGSDEPLGAILLVLAQRAS